MIKNYGIDFFTLFKFFDYKKEEILVHSIIKIIIIIIFPLNLIYLK